MRSPRSVALLLAGLCAGGGCARRPPPQGQQRLPTLPPPPEAEVVATVNGRPITIAQVAEQARASGKAPAAALEDLVRAEALVQVADERGLAGDPEVQRRAREEMARRYLKDTFEREVTPETAVSAAEIRKAYDAAGARLVHPLLKEVDHILVNTRRPDERAAALAEEIQQKAAATSNVEDFNRVAEAYRARSQELGFKLLNERVVTAREGWTDEPFAKVAFELKVDEVSKVTRSTFGYHVIRLRREIPAENITLQEATPRIRADLYPKARAREFERWMEKQSAGHRALFYPERLAELQQPGAEGR